MSIVVSKSLRVGPVSLAVTIQVTADTDSLLLTVQQVKAGRWLPLGAVGRQQALVTMARLIPGAARERDGVRVRF